jgi:hypothetical protein
MNDGQNRGREITIDNFEVETRFDMNYAFSRINDTEVEIVGDRLVVNQEHGSGYLRQSTTASIPVTVIVEMMRAAGYGVRTPEEMVEECGDGSCGQNI